jgi:hypothetical protein
MDARDRSTGVTAAIVFIWRTALSLFPKKSVGHGGLHFDFEWIIGLDYIVSD